MKLIFKVDVPDKYTHQEYKKGQVIEFEEARAKEILEAVQPNGESYAEEYIEETASKKEKESKQ